MIGYSVGKEKLKWLDGRAEIRRTALTIVLPDQFTSCEY